MGFPAADPVFFSVMNQGELHLERIEGPELPPEAARVTLPPRHAVTVGRSRECQMCLPDPMVSRHHASIAHRGGRWIVIDLDSRHGTQLNAVRLEASHPSPLDSFDLLRIGPWTFRVMIGSSQAHQARTVASYRDDATTARIARVEGREIAQHRFHLLLDGAARVNSALTETELAEAVVESVISGTGFDRAALLRPIDGTERVEVLCTRSRGSDQDAGGEFTFSRSLLKMASTGQVARLESQQEHVPLGVSIIELGITDALCAPVMLGGVVTAYLYLDARGRHLPATGDGADFCEAIARMCGLALANLKRIDLERRQRSLEAQLTAAREAQQLIVPALQNELGGIVYSMRMHPGSFVAGDLFDVVALDENRVGVVIGDVTGEGIGSAILMASAQAHLHAALKQHRDPGAALNAVNSYICERSPLDKFISMWVGVFDRGASELRYVDAGHGHWLRRRASGEIERAPLPNGTLIGIDIDLRYETRAVPIEVGERIILFSDGIIEQVDDHGEMFGIDRLSAALDGSASADEDVERAFNAVGRHAGTPKLADDATVASIGVV